MRGRNVFGDIIYYISTFGIQENDLYYVASAVNLPCLPWICFFDTTQMHFITYFCSGKLLIRAKKAYTVCPAMYLLCYSFLYRC
jgi:hypothetical protein